MILSARMRVISLFVLSLLGGPFLQAQTTTTPTIQIVSATGFSAVWPTSTTTTTQTPKLYAAAASTALTANACGTDTAGSGMRPCNPSVAVSGTSFTITFNWNKADSIGFPVLLLAQISTGNIELGRVSVTSVGQYTLTGSWELLRSNVCTGSDWTGCSPMKSFSLSLGMDTSNSGAVTSGLGITVQAILEVFDGSVTDYANDCGANGTGTSGDAICHFAVFPGDQKFYFDDLTPAFSDLTPQNGVNAGYGGLQIFFKESTVGGDVATMQSMTNDLNSSTSVGITSDDNFDIKLTDLDNDIRYCVIFAGKTHAGTIMKYFPDPSGFGAESDAQNFCGTPSQVFGLLENKKCFVATAAFGSELDPHVQRFRDFRNQILMRSSVGRVLTQFYYEHSPKYAKVIADQPILKTAVRGVLWVLLLFVELSLRFGLMVTALGSFFIFLLVYRSVNLIWSNRSSQVVSLVALVMLSSSLLMGTDAKAQTKSSAADDEFMSQDISSGPDFGSETLRAEDKTKASKQKVKKKEDTLIEQEVQSAPVVDDGFQNLNAEETLTDSATVPVEPENIFGENPPQPEITPVPEPEVFQPVERIEERKSAWDRPIEDRVVKDLIKKEDGIHYYKVKKISGNRKSTSVRIGFMPPPNITNTLADANGNETTVSYKDMYPSPTVIPVGLYEYEWSPIKSWHMLKTQLGAGAFYAQGNGRFANGEEAREKYTFIGLPVFAGAKLRMQFGNSWLVPYVAGGGTYFGLIEFRDDGKKRNVVGTPGAYGAGGLMFDLTYFDRETSWIFDRDYEISHLWLTAEARFVKTFSAELDFSSNIIFLGVSADY